MTVKIILNSGLILTVSNLVKTETHITGIDKFGIPIIVSLSDIKSMLPAKEESWDKK